MNELLNVFRTEYIFGPGVTGHGAIRSMWEDYANNSYDPDVVAGVTRDEIARMLLRLTAEIVATNSTDKMKNPLGEWVDI